MTSEPVYDDLCAVNVALLRSTCSLSVWRLHAVFNNNNNNNNNNKFYL